MLTFSNVSQHTKPNAVIVRDIQCIVYSQSLQFQNLQLYNTWFRKSTQSLFPLTKQELNRIVVCSRFCSFDGFKEAACPHRPANGLRPPALYIHLCWSSDGPSCFSWDHLPFCCLYEGRISNGACWGQTSKGEL